MLVFRKYECVVMQMLYAFCMTCCMLMLIEDERGDHMEEAYSRAGLITALEVAMSVSFCLPHPVSSFIICSGLRACTEML